MLPGRFYNNMSAALWWVIVLSVVENMGTSLPPPTKLLRKNLLSVSITTNPLVLSVFFMVVLEAIGFDRSFRLRLISSRRTMFLLTVLVK